MTKHRKRGWLAAIATIAILGPLTGPGMAAPESPPGGEWAALTDGLRAADDHIQSRLPAGLTDQDRADIRLVELGALMSAYLVEAQSDPNHPYFVPEIGLYENYFAPNPDTIYLRTAIDGAGSYVLQGRRGTVPIINLSVNYGPFLALTGKPVPHVDYDFDTLHFGPHGEFKVLLSGRRPNGYTGDWWYLDPRAQEVSTRSVSDDWGRQDDARISIERVDIPPRGTPFPPGEVRRRMALLPGFVEHATLTLANRAAQMESQGWVNKATELPIVDIGGLTSQHYFYSVVSFDPGEAVVLETDVPHHCRYWSVLLTTLVDSTIDWVNNQSSLNRNQARLDGDGKLRVVIADADPGVPNWLDTVGRNKVGMQLRWTGCDSLPVPQLRRMPMSEVRHALPADTPIVTAAQRDQALRLRSAAAQLRQQF